MNPIRLVLTGLRRQTDDPNDLEQFLNRVCEPLPDSWRIDWHRGDMVELVRDVTNDDGKYLPAGGLYRVTDIDLDGDQVLFCRPLKIRLITSDVFGPYPFASWVHPNDLRLVKRGRGRTSAQLLTEMSELESAQGNKPECGSRP